MQRLRQARGWALALTLLGLLPLRAQAPRGAAQGQAEASTTAPRAEPQYHRYVEALLEEVRGDTLTDDVTLAELDQATDTLRRLQDESDEQIEALERRLTALEEDLDALPPLAPDQPAEVTAQRTALKQRMVEVRGWLDANRANRAAIDVLATRMAERTKLAGYRRQLAGMEQAAQDEDLGADRLNRLVEQLSRLRQEVEARKGEIESQLAAVTRQLEALLPDGGPEAAAEEPTEEAAAEAPGADGEPETAAEPPVPAAPVIDEEALAGLSEGVRAEVTRLRARRSQLEAWRGEYALLGLRIENLITELQQRVQERAAAELLEPDATLLQVARSSLTRPEEWVEFARRLVEGSALPLMVQRPGLLLGALVLVAIAFVAGRNLAGRLRHRAECTRCDSFGNELLRSILACSAHHATAVLVLGAMAAVLSLVGLMIDDHTPFVTLLSYALLLFVLLRVVNRTFLAPFPPAEPLTPFPQSIEKVLARRITVLMLLGVLGFLLFKTLGEYNLSAAPFLLVRAAFVALVAVNLVWLLWLVGRLPRLARYGRFVRGLALVLLAVCLGAELLGFRNLSSYLLTGVVGSLLLMPAMWLLRRLLEELLSGLNSGSLMGVRLLRDWLGLKPAEPFPGMPWLRFVAGLVVWVGFGLLFLRIWATDAGYATAITRLDTGFSLGSLEIVPSRLVTGIVLFSIGMVLARWAQELIEKWIDGQRHLDRGAKDTIVTLAGYVGIVVAVFVALNSLDVDFTTFAVVAGALSVGIGFGLQNIVNNFVSGLILLFERPIRAGDWVQVGTTEGFVTKVGVRYTEVRTFNKSEVIVPNSDLLSQHVINKTRHDPELRVEIPVGVAYGSDVGLVRELLLEVARNHPQVRQDANPQPTVLFRGFGDSSLDFELWCVLTNGAQRFFVISDINYAIDEAFRKHDIEIPFPQRDLHVIDDPRSRGETDDGE